MQLVLTVLRYRGAPPEHPLQVRFGADGGSIGRGRDCTLVLPDTRRWVSSLHARIEQRGDDFVLVDSSRNGTYINPFLRSSMGKRPKRMEHGSAVVLKQGDEVWIGGFELLVDLSAEDGPLGLQDPAAAEAARSAGAERNLDVPTQFVGTADDDLDLDDLVGLAEPDGDDDILCVLNRDRPRSDPPPIATAKVDPLALIGAPGPSMEAASPGPSAPVTQTKLEVDRSIPENYDILADAVVPAKGAGRADPEPPPPARPPKAALRTPAPEPAAPAATGKGAAPATGAGPADLTDQFLQALGFNPGSIAAAERPRVMRNAAVLLRRLADGLIQTQAQQRETQARLLLPATEPGTDNPLRCAFNLDDTLRLLLLPQPGMIAPGAAADAAFAQLQRHEAALGEAVEASVADLRRRLDPALFAAASRSPTLGERLAGRGPEVQAWQRLLAAHEALEVEIAADPAASLGPAFAAAYRRALSRRGRASR